MGQRYSTKAVFPLIAVAFLAACAGTTLTADKGMAIGCEAYVGGLRSVTPLKPQMTLGQVAIVDKAIGVAGPACLTWAKTGQVSDGLVAAVTGAASQLLEVRTAVTGAR